MTNFYYKSFTATVVKILVNTIFYSQNAIFLQKNFTKIWLNVWLKYFCVFIQIFCRQIGNFLSLRNIFENQCKIFASFLNYFVSAFNTIADTGWIHCIVFQYKIFAYDKPKLHRYARYFKKDAKFLHANDFNFDSYTMLNTKMNLITNLQYENKWKLYFILINKKIIS